MFADCVNMKNKHLKVKSMVTASVDKKPGELNTTTQSSDH